MTNEFYRAFEDRYRGSRDVIKQRLSQYAPFLRAIAARYPDAVAIDLGCGRGEWLEVLGEQGLRGQGVDLNEGMLAAARERGLAVSRQDAMAALSALPDASVAVVSAFHLVEHIPFETVRALAAEALRVLVPGGLLIMETPNPENIVVGSSDFYTDPSHLRPIPPNLLAFVAEHAGYARHAVVRLQEDPQLRSDAPVNLLAVLSGASPDYSIVAQKAAEAGLLSGFTALFDAEYGLDMKALATRHASQSAQQHAEIHHALVHLAERISADRASSAAENQLLGEQLGQHVDQQVRALHAAQDGLAAGLADAFARLDQVDGRHQAELQSRVERLEREAAQARHAEFDTHQAELAQVRAQLLHTTADLEARLAQAQQYSQAQAQHIASILHSRSWRITAPLRLIGRAARRLRGARSAPAAADSRALTRRAVQAVLRRPALKRAALVVLAYMPGLRSRLRHLLYRQDIGAQMAPPAPPPEPLSIGEAPPRIARIYRELKQAQQARKD